MAYTASPAARIINTMQKQTAWWLLLLILVAAVSIRSFELTARSLWFDEAFSWRLIQFPWNEMIARDAADVHPPLYYVLLKSWSIVFGTSLLSLRGFSVAAGAGTLLALYLFTASAFRSRAAGVLAAALYAVAGYQIQFAWEARMYTLGTLLALLSSWVLIRAVRADKSSLKWWLAYGLFAAAFGYVHYYALFTLAAQALFIAGHILWQTRFRLGEILQWRLPWYALLSAGVALVLWSPWIGTFIRQNQQVQQSYWIPPLNRWSVPDTLKHMYAPQKNTPPRSGAKDLLLASLPLLLTASVTAFLLVDRRRRHARAYDGVLLAVLCAAVPFALSLALSLLTRSLYQERYFLYAHVFILAALAAAITRLPGRWLRVTTGAALLLLLFASYAAYWRELDLKQHPGAKAAARLVFSSREPSEPVLVSSSFIYFAILHYAQEEFNAADVPKLYSETGALSHFSGGPIMKQADLAGPSVLAQNPPVIWVVDTTGFGATPLQLPGWRVVDSQTFPEVFGYQGEVNVKKYTR